MEDKHPLSTMVTTKITGQSRLPKAPLHLWDDAAPLTAGPWAERILCQSRS